MPWRLGISWASRRTSLAVSWVVVVVVVKVRPLFRLNTGGVCLTSHAKEVLLLHGAEVKEYHGIPGCHEYHVLLQEGRIGSAIHVIAKDMVNRIVGAYCGKIQ